MRQIRPTGAGAPGRNGGNATCPIPLAVGRNQSRAIRAPTRPSVAEEPAVGAEHFGPRSGVGFGLAVVSAGKASGALAAAGALATLLSCHRRRRASNPWPRRLLSGPVVGGREQECARGHGDEGEDPQSS